jgi:hypothetical protein
LCACLQGLLAVDCCLQPVKEPCQRLLTYPCCSLPCRFRKCRAC